MTFVEHFVRCASLMSFGLLTQLQRLAVPLLISARTVLLQQLNHFFSFRRSCPRQRRISIKILRKTSVKNQFGKLIERISYGKIDVSTVVEE